MRALLRLNRSCRRGSGGSPRAGLSIIELLVVLAIIGIVLALGIPAVARARQAALKTQCLNNVHNLAFGLIQHDHLHGQLPASGTYVANGPTSTSHRHSWVIPILPWLDQTPLFNQWDLSKAITDPVNLPLTRTQIPVLTCPLDITLSSGRGNGGDLSYVVNGGVGFTVGPAFGFEDCPVAPFGGPLDLNGDGSYCSDSPEDEQDYVYFKRMGLFFLDNWKPRADRHHKLTNVIDGLSQTFLLTENVRAGYDPNEPESGFANPHPYRCAFYIGTPCPNDACSPGTVDYALSQQGNFRINSGLWSAEGSSPVPNSFHSGGVHMAYADGHVSFLSELIDGAVYAALASPQGVLLNDTPLRQVIVSQEF